MSPRSRKLLAPALSLSFLAAAFTFDKNGVSWLWSAQPIVAALLAIGAATTWTFLYFSLHRHPRPRA